MSLEDQVNAFAQQVVEFARAHEVWAAPIVGALAFGESLAFLSLVIPAWAILVALGTLIGKSGLNFWPIWVAGAVGAALGDWLSYWVGVKVGPAVAHRRFIAKTTLVCRRSRGVLTAPIAGHVSAPPRRRPRCTGRSGS